MHDHPSITELLTAVKSFIEDSAIPELTGHAAFHARVASNVLGIVLREIELGPSFSQSERERLLVLLKAAPDTSLEDLNRALVAAIRNGTLTAHSPDLVEHLKRTAFDQLKIDQPRYSGASTTDEAK